MAKKNNDMITYAIIAAVAIGGYMYFKNSDNDEAPTQPKAWLIFYGYLSDEDVQLMTDAEALTIKAYYSTNIHDASFQAKKSAAMSIIDKYKL